MLNIVNIGMDTATLTPATRLCIKISYSLINGAITVNIWNLRMLLGTKK